MLCQRFSDCFECQ